jgi:hypothetical protein
MASGKKLQKKAKKTLKHLKKEKQAAEALMNYYLSVGKYFSDQAALEEQLSVSSSFETDAAFLKEFQASEEYAKALAEYRNRRQ